MKKLIAPRWQPWQGEKYKKVSSGFGVKILIVGESFYSKEKDPRDLTKRAIEQYGKAGKHTYGALQRTLEPLLAPNARNTSIWDYVAFHNYLQTWVAKTAQDRPTREEFKKRENSEALIHVLYSLKPDLVIILGTGLFKVLSELKPGTPLRVGGIYYPTWIYDIGGNRTARVVGIKHPGKFYSADKWRPLIQAAIRGSQKKQRTATSKSVNAKKLAA